MKFACGVVVFIYLLHVSSATLPCDETPEDPKYDWETYKREHNRNYDAEEDAKRHAIFLESVRFIIKNNCDVTKGLESSTAGLNDFSDKQSHEVPKGFGIRHD